MKGLLQEHTSPIVVATFAAIGVAMFASNAPRIGSIFLAIVVLAMLTSGVEKGTIEL